VYHERGHECRRRATAREMGEGPFGFGNQVLILSHRKPMVLAKLVQAAAATARLYPICSTTAPEKTGSVSTRLAYTGHPGRRTPRARSDAAARRGGAQARSGCRKRAATPKR
jgi:hypothetical protein